MKSINSMITCTSALLIVIFASLQIESTSLSLNELRKVDVLSLGGYTSATVMAGLEIAEEVSEIGCGHSIAFLTMSKVAKEVAEVRRLSSEEYEKLDIEIKPKRNLISTIFSPVLRILSSAYTIAILAILGLYAAISEVLDETKIGIPHGALLLACHDVLELLDESRLVSWSQGISKFISNPMLKITLISSALVSSLVNIIQSLSKKKVGSHHAVLVLSTLKLLSLIGYFRNDLAEKEE